MNKPIVVLSAVIIIGVVIFSCDEEPTGNLYVNEEAGFSFLYPDNYFSDTPQSPDELVRLSFKNDFKMPVIVAKVFEIKEKIDQSKLAKDFIHRMETGIPGTSGFKIIEEKPVTLPDNTDAYIYNIKWTWADGTTGMQTVSVTAQKDDKLITLSTTALSQQNMAEEITKICMTLDINL